jgi:hypothetical protein
MILATLTPNNAFVHWDFVKSFLTASAHYPVFAVQSSGIAENRNKIYQYAQSRNDDVLMVDSDMVFTLEDVKKIEQHLKKYDIITGVAVVGMPPYKPSLYQQEGVNYNLCPLKNGVYEIDACGGAFLGISKRVKLDYPFDYLKNGDVPYGEDIAFCHRAREKGYKIWVDTSILLGHLRTKPIYYGKRKEGGESSS